MKVNIYFGTDLVSALAGLQVDDFSHFEASLLRSDSTTKKRKRASNWIWNQNAELWSHHSLVSTSRENYLLPSNHQNTQTRHSYATIKQMAIAWPLLHTTTKQFSPDNINKATNFFTTEQQFNIKLINRISTCLKLKLWQVRRAYLHACYNKKGLKNSKNCIHSLLIIIMI